ncbi:MAG TPA: family 10 glycosylhydrolase [Candidatus Limnocylindria bacterium]|nr:family 10 glycosylhydrolase [Candidatus Limnocylindria bacterium]
MRGFGTVCCWVSVAAGLMGCAAGAQPAPEFRALWADTFHAGMRNSNEVAALVNTARGANFNAIIVEVRKRCDAYYNSAIEPKASDVSPQSYDPLADLLDKAHHGGRRIEVHAWITTYLVWNAGGALPTQANHPYYTHPEWLSRDSTGATSDGNNYQFDPALPEVQRHTYDVAMDILSRYDVDGFHFDYVRYSGRTWGYHSNALERFRRRFNVAGTPSPADANWLQFRREQVSGLVRKVYLNALAMKPQVKISAATIGFAPGVVNDSQWFSSASAWGNVLQDWRGWMQEGILDLNVPMMYFDHRRHANDWNGWSLFAKEHAYGHHVALGQGSYLNTLSNVIHQLRTTRVPTANSNAAAHGLAMYSYAAPVTNDTSAVTTFNALVQPSVYDPNPVPLFAEPVATPVMPWKVAPTVGHVKGTIRATAASDELDGAVVTLAGPVTRVQTNDATGFYGFAHLPPGSYTVTASYSNLASRSAAVLVTTGVVSTVDLFLSVSNGPLLNLRAWPERGGTGRQRAAKISALRD